MWEGPLQTRSFLTSFRSFILCYVCRTLAELLLCVCACVYYIQLCACVREDKTKRGKRGMIIVWFSHVPEFVSVFVVTLV